MCQDLNIIVTIKRARQAFFQIAPMTKEKLLVTEGLQIGEILPESPQAKCKKCEDPVTVNLFWTKNTVIINNVEPQQAPLEIPKKEKTARNTTKKKQKKAPKVEKLELVEVKEEKIFEGEVKKEEPEEIIDYIDDFKHDFDDRKSSSESEYEIPKWCDPPKAPKVKKMDKIGNKYVYRDKVLCHICSKEVRKDSLKMHLYKHEVSDLRPFECNECGKHFARTATIEAHLVEKHFTDLAPFLCTSCPSKFARKSGLKKHMYDRHRIGESQKQICPHCNAQLSNKSILKSHIINLHTDPSKKRQWTCQECGKIFFKKSHYDTHVKIHLPEDQRPFRCYCGKSFIHVYKFKRHQREHENPEEILYRCPVCNKGLKYGNSLTVHMRIHTGEQPYECKFCKRKFSDRSNHRTHMKQHELEMGVKLTLNHEERRLVHHKVLKKDQLINQ